MTTIEDAIRDLRTAVQSRSYAESAFDRVTAKQTREEEQEAETALRAAIEQYAAERVADARKPLTDERITNLIRTKHFRADYKLRASDEVCLDWYRLGVHDGERAHGIGEQQNG